MRVGDIKFGEIDAKNEVFQQSRFGSQVFINAFQTPPRISIDELLSGSRFFISGQKGCGKTALLLHVRHQLITMGAKTHTILFKSGISEPERQKISVGVDFEIINTAGNVTIQYDYTINWLWLIYKNLIRLIEIDGVEDGKIIVGDLKNIMGVSNETKTSLFSDLAFNKLKVSAKAGVAAKVVSAEISAEINALRADKSGNTPIEIVELCERYLGKVKLNVRQRCILFFDELELFWNRPDQKERDLFLIRDLLRSVARVNRSLGEMSASFVVYASVRSEVLEEVNRVGPEVSRDVSDFGAIINWNVKASADRQPILNIVEAKINASEMESDESPTDDVWEQYFPEKVHGKNVEDHLLDIAMFKPRHIVSRLTLAKAHDPDAAYISAESFEETSTEFSSTVWREIEEELLVTYTAQQVSNLKAILTGYKSKLTIEDFEQRVFHLGQIDTTLLDGFRNRMEVVKAFRSLYRVGAFGNRYFLKDGGKAEMRDRWVFREYGDPKIDEAFVIHESLRKVFQLSFID